MWFSNRKPKQWAISLNCQMRWHLKDLLSMIESEKIVDWKVNRSVSRNYGCPFETTELKVIQDG